MILFIFEGQVEEPRIMTTIKQLFFKSREDQLLCSFGSDTYTLWKDIVDYQKNGYEVDVFSVIKERLHKRGDYSLDRYYSYQIESIYLFFDYDPQNKTVGLERLNLAITGMVNLFSDSMGNGQIYISYPMIEAIYCENNSEDSDYISYEVPISQCRKKEWCNVYCNARKRSNVLFRTDSNNNITEKFTSERVEELRGTWNNLVRFNAIKANYISNDECNLPEDVSEISQQKIFGGQLLKYVSRSSTVSILSSFAIFLFEYFHGNGEF